MGRRHFLTLVGASLALAGFTACDPRSREKIVPYVDQPEQIIPGKELLYATAMPLNGYGRGILVATDMGRPIKIEGNPAHPDSLGATDAVTQAAILGLWDPDRSKAPMFQGHISTWKKFESELLNVLQSPQAAAGEGMAILTEPTASPTQHRQMSALLKKYPEARWYRWSPAAESDAIPWNADFEKTDLIVSVGCDFLADQPGSLRYMRQFAARRRVQDGQARPNRLYVLESTPTITGTMADHRLSAPPDRIAAVLRRVQGATSEELDAREEAFAQKLATDLAGHRASSLVLAGAKGTGFDPRVDRRVARRDVGAQPLGVSLSSGGGFQRPGRPGARLGHRRGQKPFHPRRQPCLQRAARFALRRTTRESQLRRASFTLSG